LPNLTIRTREGDLAPLEDVVLELGNRVDKRTALDQAGGVRHEVQRPTTIILQQEQSAKQQMHPLVSPIPPTAHVLLTIVHPSRTSLPPRSTNTAPPPTAYKRAA
jgi:hypothetical protein